MLKYTIDRDRNRCSVENNPDPVHTFCIPDSATPGFQVKLGFGDNSLKATAYYDEDTLKDDKYQRGIWYIVNEGCIPLQRDRNGLTRKSFSTQRRSDQSPWTMMIPYSISHRSALQSFHRRNRRQ
ncbi:uncharacterized protein LOC124264376 [Haliotis rubra]|uniref:uncharacterized protein LOC124264376 n=1 Tax=Haliotis rubra TaxID=36100 RepID=UPI001EE54FE7|nr:uncharacterized protein LOC124264376 [Haliotis rubra]